MSKQANKTVIGSFVVGALVLVVAGIFVFGSGKFLAQKHTCVMYFEGSVKGLNEGASVVFRGVKIGTVDRIVLRAYAEELSFEIPVFIEIEPDRLERVGEQRQSPEVTMKQLIQKGLKAQLQMQSMVTGQLIVELDFHPDKPIQLRGKDPKYIEIPTIQADMAELMKKIEKVPIEKIFEKLLSAVEGIEKVVNAPEVMSSVRSLDQTLVSAHKLVENVNRHIVPLAQSIEGTMEDSRKLVQNINTQIEPLAVSIKGTADAATETIVQAEKTLVTVGNSLGEDSALIYDLNQSLNELSEAARSIRFLADYLNRHPESLIHGKGGSK